MKIFSRIKPLQILRNFFRNLNFALLGITFLLVAAGGFAVYSATGADVNPLFIKQLTWYGIGTVFLFVFAGLNYNRLVESSYYIYGFFLILLTAVLFVGHTSLGAQRWLDIGPLRFQPSEFVKIVLSFAVIRMILVNHREGFTWKNIVKILLLAGVPMLLVLKQPDLGTVLHLIPVLYTLLFMGNIKPLKLGIITLAAAALMPIAYFFLRDYQKQRLLVFLNPEIDPLGAGYNVIQSQIAVGSGMLFGKGFAQGTQSQLDFIPIKYTDFVFAVIGEEFGFFGGFIIIAIYLMLVMEALKIAKLSKNRAGKMMASAIAAVIFSQVFINIGMNMGIMPVTGITLPLLSYGGTSVLVIMISLGILQNIYREYMKAEEK